MRFYKVYQHTPENFYPDMDNSYRRNETVELAEPIGEDNTVLEVLVYDIDKDVVDKIIDEKILSLNYPEDILQAAIEDGYIDEDYPYNMHNDFSQKKKDWFHYYIEPQAKDISNCVVIQYEFIKYVGYAVKIKRIALGQDFGFKTNQDVPYSDHAFKSNYIVTDITASEAKTMSFEELYNTIESYIHYPIQGSLDIAVTDFMDNL